MSNISRSVPRDTIAARLRAAGSVFAEEEAELLLAATADAVELEEMIEARVAGEPLEQVLGWVEFFGHRIAVAPGLFVPRRRTELLVTESLKLLVQGSVVVELCCGVAAMGAAILAAAPEIELYASDIDPVAVSVARVNLQAAGRVFEGDLFDALPVDLRGRIHVVVANAPYVPTESIELLPREARMFEPLLALDGGPDGLDIHRRIASEAPTWLASGGHLLLESSEPQESGTAAILESHGFAARIVHSGDVDGTVVVGTLARSRP
jgi:release factor glutamine methyltransferase